ncbi:uncharacterized protein [Salvelinus alpinus]|uniref:uncharacterized protein isoform X1 n=1 Tax=Salvelinus alpinus TaxID=8036 RepID=UPI0039FC6EB5
MCLLIYWHIECFLSRHWALWNLCACRCTSEMRPSGHYQPLTELLCQSMGPHLNSVNELNQWLLALRKACSHNRHSFHPGVYTGERWSCCHQKDKADNPRHQGLQRALLHGNMANSRDANGVGAASWFLHASRRQKQTSFW